MSATSWSDRLGGNAMDAEKRVPEAGKGRVPVALYVLIEERLNARWAAARKEQMLLHPAPERSEQGGKRP